ncbi:hypothetical protein AB7M74_009035 [Bradyrhizobium japonicum]
MTLKFGEPAVHEPRRIVIVWVEKAREHSRGRASPPFVIGEGPQLDEQQARIPGQLADGLRLRKLGLDRPDARHQTLPALAR